MRPLCKLLEGCFVLILDGKFFVLKASSVSSNVVTLLNKPEHYVFLCLLGILRVVIWTARPKEFYEGKSFSSQTLVAYYKHLIKVKIRSKRERLLSLGLSERWITVVCMCHV